MTTADAHFTSLTPLGQISRRLEMHPYLTLSFLALLSCLVFYLPFFIKGEMDIVFRFWDGPNYAFLAKTLYFIEPDHPLNPYNTPEYFAAHLPLYPLTIKLFSFIGYNNAMLFTTMLFTVSSTLVVYELLKETQVVESPLWSAFISLFIPARYIIFHSVGATEAPFIFFTLASLLAYLRDYYVLAFILAGLSGITRITGILMGVVYFILLALQKQWRKTFLLPIIGLPLLLTFTFYYFHYGDFFAYFGVNLSEDNSLLYFQPFYILSYYSSEGDGHSAELYLAMYAVYGAGVLSLFNKNKVLFTHCAVMYVFSLFICHHDLSRYLIPIAPLALVAGYDAILKQRAVKYASFLLIALSYNYAWQILPHNVMVDWVYQDLIKFLN